MSGYKYESSLSLALIFFIQLMFIPFVEVYGVNLDLNTVNGPFKPGDEVTINMSLNAGGAAVSAVAMDIGFDANIFTNPVAGIAPGIGPGTESDRQLISNVVSPGLFRIGIIPNSFTQLSLGKTIPNVLVAAVTFDIVLGASPGDKILTNTPSSSTSDGQALLTVGTDATVTIQTQEVRIPFCPGWSLMSYPINRCFYVGQIPVDQPSWVILENVEEQGYESLKDWLSAVMSPGNGWEWVIGVNGVLYNDLPSQFQSLSYMSVISGYWLKIRAETRQAILTLSGPFAGGPNNPIPLVAGWNLPGCLLDKKGYYDSDIPTVCVHVPEGTTWERIEPPAPRYVFSSIHDKCNLIIGDIGAYDPNLPAPFNTLNWVAAGYAYWINVSEPCDLIYYWEPETEVPTLSLSTAPGKQFARRTSVTPTRDFMLVYGDVNRDGMATIAGSQVQVFSQSGVLCGESTVTHPGYYGVMVVYGDDESTARIEGAKPEERLTFYVNGEIADIAPGVGWAGGGSLQRLDLAYQSHPRPKVSMLCQNYPNPCNPDTWIPYQLREDADVVINIYTATGQLVRTLSLGLMPAGFYIDREKAAHWDGKNEAGESIASGVYFYTIHAGGFTDTKKLVIAR